MRNRLWSLLLASAALAPGAGAAAPLHFVVYGDTRFTAPQETQATLPSARRALVAAIAAERPAAVFLDGDLPWHGVAEDYAAFAQETQPWRAAHLRFYPALGNHEFAQCAAEQCLQLWWSAFPELRGRRWYEARLGARVAALVLDSNSSLLAGSEQRLWLESRLAQLSSRVRFVVLVLHHPPVADLQSGRAAGHNPRPNELALAEYLGSAAAHLRAHVVVVAGHIHNYERFERAGVTYLVSGGGGGGGGRAGAGAGRPPPAPPRERSPNTTQHTDAPGLRARGGSFCGRGGGGGGAFCGRGGRRRPVPRERISQLPLPALHPARRGAGGRDGAAHRVRRRRRRVGGQGPVHAAVSHGPWNPGVLSHIPTVLQPQCTIFRPEHVFTSYAAAQELHGLTGIAPAELVAFRPERLVLHELLIRVTADLEVPDGSRIEDLGINFREITARLLRHHIDPQMPALRAVFATARQQLRAAVEGALARISATAAPARPPGGGRTHAAAAPPRGGGPAGRR